MELEAVDPIAVDVKIGKSGRQLGLGIETGIELLLEERQGLLERPGTEVIPWRACGPLLRATSRRCCRGGRREQEQGEQGQDEDPSGL
jgi:hypothetical protein